MTFAPDDLLELAALGTFPELVLVEELAQVVRRYDL
jgi:hypothetical protein